jgi:cation diffusion facilitator family transporter
MEPTTQQERHAAPGHPDDTHEHDHDHEQAAQGHGDHDHGDGHEHAHGDHDHDHDHGTGLGGLLGRIFHTHGHSEQRLQRAADPALDNAEGIRTIWLALGALTLTTVMQIAIVALSGSVALLADTVHNFGDALNSVPLLIAFYLARRAANRRYTYGYGKAEDVAGIVIVLSIVISAGVTFWQSFQKLLNPQPIEHLAWVVAAAIIGFLGNEAVALLQIHTGRRIGSAAMIADGVHARTDGLTSLAVLPAALGSYLGYPIVDPLVGIVIGIAIVFIARDAVVTVWYRLLDAIDPETVSRIEATARTVAGVQSVGTVRVRWVGHRLHADIHVVVDEDLPTYASHAIAEDVRHALLHDLPYLSVVNVHVDPCGHSGADPHSGLAHHDAPTPAPA